MGLDMYLYARKYVSAYSFSTDEEKSLHEGILTKLDLDNDDIDHDTKHINIEVPVMYWRKANQIHEWFVQNVQDGNDDCGRYFLDHDTLHALMTTCNEVSKARDEDFSADELPVQEGCFFGSYEYDEYYYEQVEETAKQIEAILGNDKLKGFDFIYTSSW